MYKRMTKFRGNDVIKGLGRVRSRIFFNGGGVSQYKRKQKGFVFYEIVKGMAATPTALPLDQLLLGVCSPRRFYMLRPILVYFGS